MNKVFLAVTSFWLTLLLSLGAIVSHVSADELISPAPDDAKIYIISPQNGDTVPETFTIKFGLSGMGVAPAGVNKENTGHHHLLVDLKEYPNFEESLPANDSIRHFGGGQTETQITLAPGEHTLQLLLGNYVHIPHDKPVISSKINVVVEENK